MIINKATRTIASTIGVVFGIGGFGHGFFESLQGNTPTGALVVPAIGEAQRFWEHGNEFAFTLIPNFLVSGITTMIVSLIIIFWSIKNLDQKRGPLVFLLLYCLLFLVGGGIGQVIFFTITYAFATRITKPLTGWRKIIPPRTRPVLAKLWRPLLILNAVLILFTLQIAIFGFVPGLSDPDRIMTVMLLTLGGGLISMLAAFICGFADDIKNQIQGETV